MQVRSAQSEALTIFDLPAEILVEISLYLPPQALVYLSLANRLSRSLILSDVIWHSKFIKHFQHIPNNDNAFVQFTQASKAEHKRLRHLSKRQRRLFLFIKENDLQSIEEGKFTLDDLDVNYEMLCWANSHHYQKILDYFYSLAVEKFSNNFLTMNVTHRDERYRSIFEFAVICNQSQEYLDLLLSQGACLNGIPKKGRNDDVFKIRDIDHLTPLMLAALAGNKDMVAFLLEKGALINQRSFPRNNVTALMLAVRMCHVDIVEYLVNQGANASLSINNNSIFFPIRRGDTPLIAAIRLAQRDPSYKAIIEILMTSRAAFHSSKKSPYYPPLVIASMLPNTEIAEMLLKHWPDLDLSSLDKWIRLNCLNYIKLLVNFREQLEALGANLRSLEFILMKAVKYDLVDIARFVLEKPCDINVRDILQKTPLMNARSTQMTKLLLAKGADATLEDETGFNALLHAVIRGNKGPVAVLLESLKNTFDPDQEKISVAERFLTKTYINGDTILHIAATVGNTHVIELLTKAGSQPTIRNTKGDLPKEIFNRKFTSFDSIPTQHRLQNYISIIRPTEKPFHYTFKIAGHSFLATPVTLFGHTFNLSQEAKLAAASDLYAVVFEEKNIDLSKHRACYFNGRLGRIYKELENKGLISRYQLSPMGHEQSSSGYDYL